jgi:hypothetical protein
MGPRGAFCSCIEIRFNFRRGDEPQGVNFDDAKLHVAQILGREDLLKGENPGRYQATDAPACSRLPSHNRDDDLVFRYLGARLGIDPAEVPAPSTRVVKLLCLRSASGVKTKLIGFWPCAVFETAAASRRRARVCLASAGKS